MELNPQQQRDQAQMNHWNSLGCEMTRFGMIRMPHLKKVFRDPETVVTRQNAETGEWEPFLLRSGRPLTVGECMEPHADLALEDDGRMVSQLEFENRYKQFLDTFIWDTGSDPKNEPIPEVSEFLNRKPDIYGGSRACVEIDFDPFVNGEFTPKKFFGPNGESEEKWREENMAQSEKIDALAGAVSKLVELELAKNGVTAPAPDPGDEGDEPPPIAAAAETADPDAEPPKKRRGRPPKNRE